MPEPQYYSASVNSLNSIASLSAADTLCVPLEDLERCVHLLEQQPVTSNRVPRFLQSAQHCTDHKQQTQVQQHTANMNTERDAVIHPAMMIPSVGFCTFPLLTASTVLEVKNVDCVATDGT